VFFSHPFYFFSFFGFIWLAPCLPKLVTSSPGSSSICVSWTLACDGGLSLTRCRLQRQQGSGAVMDAKTYTGSDKECSGNGMTYSYCDAGATDATTDYRYTFMVMNSAGDATSSPITARGRWNQLILWHSVICRNFVAASMDVNVANTTCHSDSFLHLESWERNCFPLALFMSWSNRCLPVFSSIFLMVPDFLLLHCSFSAALTRGVVMDRFLWQTWKKQRMKYFQIQCHFI